MPHTMIVSTPRARRTRTDRGDQLRRLRERVVAAGFLDEDRAEGTLFIRDVILQVHHEQRGR